MARRLALAAAVLGGGVGAALVLAAPVPQGPDGAQPKQLARQAIVAGIAANRPNVAGHVVEDGETWATLAVLYDTSAATLEVLNPGLSALQPGLLVVVPDPGPPPDLLPCGDTLAPVDKQRALPEDCAPAELAPLPANIAYVAGQRMEPRAAAALVEMVEAALEAGHRLVVRSSYRSYEEQVETFQYWVAQLGYERALEVSAQAGHSEHQLGTTADLTNADAGYGLVPEFGDTPGGIWLAANSWRYGFIMSYPRGEQDTTGYDYEPWHFRWVGVEAAADVHESGRTLHSWLLNAWRPGRWLLPNP